MKLPENRHPHLAVLEEFEDSLREVLARSGALLRPELGLLHWIQKEGDTFVAAVPVPNTQSKDEIRPICLLTITSLLKTRPKLSDEQINACNRLAGLSMLTRQKNQQQVMAASSFTIYDDPAQREMAMYLALQTTFLQRSWLSSVLNGLEHDFRKEMIVYDPIGGRAPSRWTNEEMLEIYKELIEAGYKSRLFEHGIVAVLNKNNVPGEGSFLQIRNDISHPLYGNGLTVTFVLPEEKGVNAAELENRCLAWNLEEAHTILPAPAIGAWFSMYGRAQLQHQVFVPNSVHTPQVGHIVTDSAIQRWATRLADTVREI